MEAVVARGIQVLLALGGAYLLALWFVLVVWTFRDIETRSRSAVTQIFSTLLAVLFYVPGVLLYLILRPKETLDSSFQRSLEEEYLLQDLEELPLCPNCQHYVEEDYRLCPNCQTTLRDSCRECGRLIDLKWTLCPYCGTEQGKGERLQALPKPVERWATPMVQPGMDTQRPKVSLRRAHATAAVEARIAAAEPGDAPRVPVRLFDRRKTRELARMSMNGYGPKANGAAEPFGAGAEESPGELRFRPFLRQAPPAQEDAQAPDAPAADENGS